MERDHKPIYGLGNGIDIGEQKRLQAISVLGMLQAETMPVFEAATQTAADILEIPICILGFQEQRFTIKSAVGLSRLGLINKIAQERQLPSEEPFCTYVVKNNKILAIEDTLKNPNFANSVMVQQYGIRAFLGVPLVDFSGQCLGAIAVMALQPSTFTIRDIKFLELMACWSMSELERNKLLKAVNTTSTNDAPLQAPQTHTSPPPNSTNGNSNSFASWLLTNDAQTEEININPAKTSSSAGESLAVNQFKLELLSRLTQELRTPLTSILGMASVVSREIYGPLTNKQKEYIEIIENSGRHLLSLVNEISELGALEDSFSKLNLTSVDVEILCQQVISTLSDVSSRREQQIRLSLEPGINRIWALDKEKVRQLLYQLLFSIIQVATNGSVIHIHVAHKNDGINLVISVSHPWLGEGLNQVDPYFSALPVSVIPDEDAEDILDCPDYSSADVKMLPVSIQPLGYDDSSSNTLALPNTIAVTDSFPVEGFYRSSESLRLLLSCELAKIHDGQVVIQGTPESGYRYVVILPELTLTPES